MSFSHELRNPLNTLIGNLDLGLQEKDRNLQTKFFSTAKKASELLVHLVNNILDGGKSEIGDLDINPAQTNIISFLEKVWNLCGDLIVRKGL